MYDLVLLAIERFRIDDPTTLRHIREKKDD